MMKRLFLLVVLLQHLAPPVEAHHSTGHGRPVTATVYHPWYNGRATACGQTYRHWGISAAHPWLPCGTQVRVSHGGRTLTVPITDRCACNSIDLSAGAARRLGVPVDGIATVRITHP
jgi:rare lipoprotein A